MWLITEMHGQQNIIIFALVFLQMKSALESDARCHMSTHWMNMQLLFDQQNSLLLYLNCIVTVTLILRTVMLNHHKSNFNHMRNFCLISSNLSFICWRKLPEDGQQLRPKHVETLTSTVAMQDGDEFYVRRNGTFIWPWCDRFLPHQGNFAHAPDGCQYYGRHTFDDQDSCHIHSILLRTPRTGVVTWSKPSPQCK